MRHLLERCFFAVERLVTALLYPVYVLRRRVLGDDGRVSILMYHQIGSPWTESSRQDCISPERLETQVRAILGAGYRVVPLARLVRQLEEGPAVAIERSVAITFDDGYRDQFRNAYPILLRCGAPATFFLVAGFVGKENAYPHLQPDVDASATEAQPPAGWLPLSWWEAADMLRNGMAIGSHSTSHRSLGCLGATEAEAEIRGSKELLEERLGVSVELFAYPFGSLAYGDFDERVQAMLRRAGYRAACTTVVGRNGREVDPFALRRIPMEESDGPFRVRCKLAGAYDWVGGVKNLWQRWASREERVDAALAVQEGDR